MTCAACVSNVEKALSSIPGVLHASVNLATEKASVQAQTEDGLAAAIAKGLKQAGYGIGTQEVSLNIEGMTCAACVGHVESALRSVPGVTEASVNLAAERANVSVASGLVTIDKLVRSVEGAGYGARIFEGAAQSGTAEESREKEIHNLRRKLIFAGAMGVMLFLGCFEGFPWVPALMESNYYLLLLWAAATPVQFWAGLGFYRSGFGAIRHGRANMHTLIALGTTTAYAFSGLLVLLHIVGSDALAVPGLGPRRVLRHGGHHHRAGAAGPLPGGAVSSANLRRHSRTYEPASRKGQGAAERQGDRHPRGGRGSGRPGPDSPRRAGSGGRGCDGRVFLRGRIDDYRRKRPRRKARGRPGIRGDDESNRVLEDRGHPGRRRHGAFPDNRPRGGSAGVESPHPTSRRRGRLLFRACNSGPRRGGLPDLAHRRPFAFPGLRAAGLRCGGHHRLPLRPRPRHAHGHNGGRRQRRRGGHPRPQRRDAGARPSGGHSGYGQDGHPHDRKTLRHEPRRPQRKREGIIVGSGVGGSGVGTPSRRSGCPTRTRGRGGIRRK